MVIHPPVLRLRPLPQPIGQLNRPRPAPVRQGEREREGAGIRPGRLRVVEQPGVEEQLFFGEPPGRRLQVTEQFTELPQGTAAREGERGEVKPCGALQLRLTEYPRPCLD